MTPVRVLLLGSVIAALLLNAIAVMAMLAASGHVGWMFLYMGGAWLVLSAVIARVIGMVAR